MPLLVSFATYIPEVLDGIRVAWWFLAGKHFDKSIYVELKVMIDCRDWCPSFRSSVSSTKNRVRISCEPNLSQSFLSAYRSNSYSSAELTWLDLMRRKEVLFCRVESGRDSKPR
jgi:hypothetical protein